MNRFYEIYQSGKKVPLKEVTVYRGDKPMQCRVGCFEALFVIDDENQIKKMECNFLLESPEMHMRIVHPDLYYVNLPSDLLKKVEPYEYRMKLTTAEKLSENSRFTKYFDGYAQQGWQQVKDLEETISEIRTDENKRLRTTLDCEEIYETIELPRIAKFRCRNIKLFPETECFGLRGVIFNFSTSVPSIVSSITYNTLTGCNIEQFHGGTGDNRKQDDN